jgi:hypothetical protein
MGRRFRELCMAIALRAGTVTALAATAALTISGPVHSVPAGTITVIDATPSAPWHQRSEVLGLLGPAVTLIVGLLAAYLTFRNSLRLQAENKRNEFKLQIYQDFCKSLDEAVDTISSVSLYPVFAANEAKGGETFRQMGMPPTAMKADANEFSDKFAEASREVAEVIRLIERYLIVQPDLDVFRLGLNAALFDARKLQEEIQNDMFKWFPIRRPADKTNPEQAVNIQYVPPDLAEAMSKKAWDFYGKVNVLGDYMDDLRRELQIHLLRGLFPATQIPMRKPIDPDVKVITLDEALVPALRKHFLEDTPWGKDAAQTETDVKEHFENKHGKAKVVG